jgi:excisionase family DNA binding protein
MRHEDEHVDVLDASRLLVTAAEAAQMLAISERMLWQLTKNREIPPVRIGRAVRYDRNDLRRWIESRKETNHGQS